MIERIRFGAFEYCVSFVIANEYMKWSGLEALSWLAEYGFFSTFYEN